MVQDKHYALARHEILEALADLQANRDAWTGDEFTITTPGIAEQLPDVTVPDGFEAVIRGHPDNTGYIYVGRTKAQAEAHTIPLGPDDSYSLKVSNVNLVWVDIQVAAEKGIYIVEQ